MKNLVLRANIMDKNVRIEHKVLPLPLKENTIELTISPVPGYVIEASNLSHGLLPTQIDSIVFFQKGDNVVARVAVSKYINTALSQNVSLPLISNSILNLDSFKLTDRGFKENERVISDSISSFFYSENNGEKTYSVSCAPGETKLVLTRSIRAIGNRYFKKSPSYSITGNSGRYTVKDELLRDKKNRIIGKKFNVYYTSPIGLDKTGVEDFIDFSFDISSAEYTRNKKPATKKEEYDVYSFSEGRKIGTEGGIKAMKVRGVPGTEFKIILQNGDKEVYDFGSSSGFTTTPVKGMFLGTIPPVGKNNSYGEYIVYANIPRSNTNSTIRTIFTTDKPIDHVLLQQAVKSSKDPSIPKPRVSAADPVIAAVSVPKGIAEDVEVISYSQLSWEFGNGGAFSLKTIEYSPLETRITEGDLLSRGTIKTIKAIKGATSPSIGFAVTIVPAANYGIEIERQPLLGAVGGFVNWDSGSGKAAATTSAGVKIPMDWYLSDEDVESGIRFNGGARVKGIGKPKTGSGGEDLYGAVAIEGELGGIIHGNKDTLAKLDLLNFLTLHAL